MTHDDRIHLGLFLVVALTAFVSLAWFNGQITGYQFVSVGPAPGNGGTTTSSPTPFPPHPFPKNFAIIFPYSPSPQIPSDNFINNGVVLEYIEFFGTPSKFSSDPSAFYRSLTKTAGSDVAIVGTFQPTYADTPNILNPTQTKKTDYKLSIEDPKTGKLMAKAIAQPQAPKGSNILRIDEWRNAPEFYTFADGDYTSQFSSITKEDCKTVLKEKLNLISQGLSPATYSTLANSYYLLQKQQGLETQNICILTHNDRIVKIHLQHPFFKSNLNRFSLDFQFQDLGQFEYPIPTPTKIPPSTPAPSPSPIDKQQCINNCITPKIDECSSICGEGMTKKILKCNANCLKLETKKCRGTCTQATQQIDAPKPSIPPQFVE